MIWWFLFYILGKVLLAWCVCVVLQNIIVNWFLRFIIAQIMALQFYNLNDCNLWSRSIAYKLKDIFSDWIYTSPNNFWDCVGLQIIIILYESISPKHFNTFNEKKNIINNTYFFWAVHFKVKDFQWVWQAFSDLRNSCARLKFQSRIYEKKTTNCAMHSCVFAFIYIKYLWRAQLRAYLYFFY